MIDEVTLNDFITGLAFVLSVFALYVARIDRKDDKRGEYHSISANLNHSFSNSTELVDLIMKVRTDPAFASPGELTRYNTYLLGLLQFFDSDLTIIKDNKGEVVYDKGYSLLIQSSLNCNGGKKYWNDHKTLHSSELQDIVGTLLSKSYGGNTKVIYADVVGSET